MSRVEKKVWPEYFERILDGSKTFEFRVHDFEIAEGDILVLREWDKETGEYTGRSIEKLVGYVGTWKLEDLKQFSHGRMEDI